MLASCEPNDLLPWSRILSLSQDEFVTLDSVRPTYVARRWALGGWSALTEKRRFYLQSAAVAHYLFRAEGGRRRDLLLEALGAWYTDGPIDLGPLERLGEAARQWALEEARDGSGSRPPFSRRGR